MARPLVGQPDRPRAAVHFGGGGGQDGPRADPPRRKAFLRSPGSPGGSRPVRSGSDPNANASESTSPPSVDDHETNVVLAFGQAQRRGERVTLDQRLAADASTRIRRSAVGSWLSDASSRDQLETVAVRVDDLLVGVRRAPRAHRGRGTASRRPRRPPSREHPRAGRRYPERRVDVKSSGRLAGRTTPASRAGQSNGIRKSVFGIEARESKYSSVKFASCGSAYWLCSLPARELAQSSANVKYLAAARSRTAAGGTAAPGSRWIAIPDVAVDHGGRARAGTRDSGRSRFSIRWMLFR